MSFCTMELCVKPGSEGRRFIGATGPFAECYRSLCTQGLRRFGFDVDSIFFERR
jgi:hypothetical protein